jgi:hypothetical protein
MLDEKKKAEILAILSTGCSRRTAASYVRCDPKTIYNTARQDEEFANKLQGMECAAEIAHLMNINRAGKQPNFWRASAWHLERLNPDKYGRRSPDLLSPRQVCDFISCMCSALLEEVPVARFRKRIIARINEMIGDVASCEWTKKPFGKNSRGKVMVLPRDTPFLTDETDESTDIQREKPEGKLEHVTGNAGF